MRKLSILLMLTAVAASAQSGPARAKSAGAAVLPKVENLKFPELREVKLPQPTTFTLPNGMRVYLLENHELPLVSGTALVRTGNLFDPPDKVGLAGITGTVLRSGGTQKITGDQLDEMLENVAASVEANIGETSGSVSFSALKENTDQVLDLFRDVLTNPAFRDDKLELAKTQTRSAIARRNDDPDGIANREFASIVYGRDNPYGWEMEYQHIDNIKREDLVNFYQRYFFPPNVMLAVSGDFKTAEMKAKLEKLFADWNVKKEPVPAFPQVKRQADAAGVYLGKRTDVTQTFFDMGHLGGVLKDKDYPALSVMSDILGGGFASRLFLNVRTQKGLAYNIGGGWGANYGHPGLFRIGGSTKSPSTVDAIKAAKEEVERIRTTEVTPQELAVAKDSVLNSFVFNFDHPRKILNRYVIYEYWGYPKDFIFQYQKAVENVTAADVLRVAKEHLSPERFAIVAVGNPAEFGKPLTELGKVQELDLTIPEPGAKKSAAPADPASAAKARALFERAQKAMGGVEKLQAVKDFSVTSQAKINSPQGGTMNVTTQAQFVAPDVFRTEQQFPFGKITGVWDGKSGWLATPQGTMPMPPPVQKQVQSELFRLPVRLMLGDRLPGRVISAAGDNAVEIQGDGLTATIEFDPSTGLPARVLYTSQGMQGGPAKVSSTLSDWRDVNGVRLPFKATLEQNGKPFGESTVTEAKINSGLAAGEVGKKP